MSEPVEIALALAEDIGFAIATMKAFMGPPGTTSQRIHEAIDRLEDSNSALSLFLTTLPGDEVTK